MTPHRPVTTGEARAVRQLVEAGVASRIIAPLVGRSFHGANYVRKLCDVHPPKMRHLLSFHVSDDCHGVLDASARGYRLQIGVVARSCLELLARGHAPLAERVLAPAAVAAKSAPLSSLQPQLIARV
jgi:hypothetical protein